MSETQLYMHADLRPEILDGSRCQVWRPGHRDYRPGPAQIQFIEDGTLLDIVITKVEHVRAEGKYRVFMDFMVAMGQAKDDAGKITLIEWDLVN